MRALATLSCTFCERRALLRPDGSAPATPLCNRHRSDGTESRDSERSRRKRAVRGKTISVKRMTKRELELGKLLYPETETDYAKPTKRAECSGGQRPCPFVSCKHHLFIDVSQRTGSIKLNFPDLEPDELRESCSLDVADRGGETLEEVGAILNITRERLRQIEVGAFAQLRRIGGLPRLDDFEHPRRFLPIVDTRGVDEVESVPGKLAHTPATEAAKLAVQSEINSAEASARTSQ